MTRNSPRRSTKTERVILDAEARGGTTALTADPIDAATIATPATTARIRSAITVGWYAVGLLGGGRDRFPRRGGGMDLVRVRPARDESVRHHRGGQQDQAGDQDREM